MSQKQLQQAETLDVALRRADGSWTDEALVREFVDRLERHDLAETWYLARWTPHGPKGGGLVINLSGPERESDPNVLATLLEEIEFKLAHGLSLASRERGWPVPRFQVRPVSRQTEEGWGYSFELGPFRTEPVVLYPNKVLAVAEEEALSPLLGLECVDPVFGLPAKWVTFSQSERAAQQGSLLFESAEVVMGHAINFIQTRMEYAVGLWELNQWLSVALPHQTDEALEELVKEQPFLLKLVRELLAERLYLPPPSRFWEHFQVARASGADLDPDEIALLVRREVVNDNVGRWLDDSGQLNIVEWKGPGELKSEDHHRMLRRLGEAIEEAAHQPPGGTPLLLVQAEHREELANALHGLFPDLPVLAWSDLKDLSNIQIVASVNANLSVDPPAVPFTFFTTHS